MAEFLYWCADVSAWLEQGVFAPLTDWLNERADEVWMRKSH